LEDWLPEDSVQTVTASSLRRALIYPYIRNYDFAVYMMTQVTAILRQGIRCVVRCLLKTRTILDRSEMFYLGNKLFLDPYLAWVQAHSTTLSAKFVSLAETVEKVLLDDGLKGTLGFDLLQIEATAQEEGDADSSESESEDDESDSSSDEDSSSNPDKADQSETPQDQDGPTSTETEDARSSELLDSNLGKSVLSFAQPSTGTGPKILESEPTKNLLISTKTEDARSSELLDSNLGKSVLAIAQPSTGTGPKILESEPTKNPLLSTKTEDARSSELLDSNLGKSVLAIAQPATSTGTGPKILESEPTKKFLIEEIE
jgi:hypothetical protein